MKWAIVQKSKLHNKIKWLGEDFEKSRGGLDLEHRSDIPNCEYLPVSTIWLLRANTTTSDWHEPSWVQWEMRFLSDLSESDWDWESQSDTQRHWSDCEWAGDDGIWAFRDHQESEQHGHAGNSATEIIVSISNCKICLLYTSPSPRD